MMYILVFIPWALVLISTTLANQLLSCAYRVERCPDDINQWTNRTIEMNCSNQFGYVCMRDSKGHLYETCMVSFEIRAKNGCPTLQACFNNKSFIGPESSYFNCPEEVHGCPPANNSKYSIHKLYQYKRCIQSNVSFQVDLEDINQQTTRKINVSLQSNSTLKGPSLQDESMQGLHILIVLAVVMVLICVIMLYFCSNRCKGIKRTVLTAEDGSASPVMEANQFLVRRQKPHNSEPSFCNSNTIRAEEGSTILLMQASRSSYGNRKRHNSEPSYCDSTESVRILQRHVSDPGESCSVETDSPCHFASEDEKIDKAFLVSLSQLLCESSHCISFARRLGLSDVKIHTIKHDHDRDGLMEVSYQIMAALQKNGILSYKREAIKTLKDMGLSHIIQQLCLCQN